jgi:hypothetical protein
LPIKSTPDLAYQSGDVPQSSPRPFILDITIFKRCVHTVGGSVRRNKRFICLTSLAQKNIPAIHNTILKRTPKFDNEYKVQQSITGSNTQGLILHVLYSTVILKFSSRTSANYLIYYSVFKLATGFATAAFIV